MRSRWYHRPLLHQAGSVEKKASWLELFYDLVFVAAFIQLGDGLSRDVSIAGFFRFCGIFTTLWVAWTGATFYFNRYTVDDFLHRALVFVQMFAVVAMAVSAPAAFRGEHAHFAIAYAVAQAVVWVLYLRSYVQVSEGREYAKYWGGVFLVGAGVWLLSAFVPFAVAGGLWAVGVALIFVSPLSRQSRAISLQYPIDAEHLGERYGLLTMIVLGESFVKVIGGLPPEGGLQALWHAGILLLLTCAVWWIYFDDVGGSRIKPGRFHPIVWLYSHLPLQIAITAMGVGVKKCLGFDFGDKYRWLLAGTLALVLISVAITDSVTERRNAELSDRNRVGARFASGILILVLAASGGALSGSMLVLLLTLVVVGQVVFDMVIAPFEETPRHAHAETAEPRETHVFGGEGEKPGSGTKHLYGEAVRKGTPSELRRDLHFYFMEGGWTRFILILCFLFFFLNLFFAGLYMLRPDCIQGGRANSFPDAFFFSVQTMTTIGYGGLSPATDYGNVIVTLEAATGILFTALATGLLVAKASRPTSGILFSKRMVIYTRHGEEHLVFRAGNARGSDIVDASVQVTAVAEERTPEGEAMLRMHDIELVRERSPLFAYTWSVMHRLEPDGQLRAWLDNPDGPLRMLIVTLSGHDDTYGRTIYERHTYQAGDIRPGHRFADIHSFLPDGRLLLDYSRFHDVEPTGDSGPDAE